MLNNLLEVSLLEQYYNHHTDEYLIAPLVRSWLLENQFDKPEPVLQQQAAEYLLWQLEQLLNTSWVHRLATHQALTNANLLEQAHKLVLDWVIEPLNNAGLYQQLLDKWLPPLVNTTNLKIRGEALNQTGKQFLHIGSYETALNYLQQSHVIQQEIGDKLGKGTTLNNISQIFKARGDYETALDYLQQSLAIQQEIGDVAGLCVTLFNMGHNHFHNEQNSEAIQAWLTVYKLANKIQLAQALNALENFAGDLGLEGGLNAWEQLEQQMNQQDIDED